MPQRSEGLNYFTGQVFTLDAVVAKTQKLLACIGASSVLNDPLQCITTAKQYNQFMLQ